MKVFDDVNPASVLTDKRIIGVFSCNDEYSVSGAHYFILSDSGCLLFVVCCLLFVVTSLPTSTLVNPTGLEWCGGILLEISVAGFKWFVAAIENRFLKTEVNGGLPRGVYTIEAEVGGEKLSVARMFGVPGYSLRNHSRSAHVIAQENLVRPQELELSDELLFELNYFAELKRLANSL